MTFIRFILALVAVHSAAAAPPTITSFTADSVVPLGGRFTLAVVATGTQPFLCVWKKNGVQLPDSTNELHTIYSFQPSDAGSYVVTVFNAEGSATSNPAVLSVAGTPPPGSSGNFLAGTPITFSASVASGSPPITFEWLRDETKIATGSSFVIQRAAITDAGEYKLRASNTAGEAFSGIYLLGIVSPPPGNPPVITVAPASLALPKKATARFSVSATGTGLMYQWSKNGFTITGATSSTYTIPSVRPPDAGLFSVQVSNQWGAVTPTAATLTVR